METKYMIWVWKRKLSQKLLKMIEQISFLKKKKRGLIHEWEVPKTSTMKILTFEVLNKSHMATSLFQLFF